MNILYVLLIVLAAIIIFPIALASAICLFLVLFYLLIYILCSITELICGVFTALLKFLKLDRKDHGKQREMHDQEL